MGTDEEERASRIRDAARLKAARWLAAGLDEKGRLAPVSTSELANREGLRANRITKNRLEDIEQMEARARPIELDAIGQALGVDMAMLDAAMLEVPGPESAATLARRLALLEQTLDALLRPSEIPEDLPQGGGAGLPAMPGDLGRRFQAARHILEGRGRPGSGPAAGRPAESGG